ncbi:MAG: hypothetical protein KAS32_08335 [Candidatus Peribacteraceae bacterium]|nr:hypothetical protein [Candidatus Peribacteraceae bacterium]
MINNEEYSIILPGRIVEFFPEDQTATILISVERVTHSSNKTDELTKRTPLEGVPVHTPSGGGWSITMPIKAGDTCLLFFSQVGYEHWLYDDADTAGTLAELPKPWLSRQFNEDDGFALVGMNTLPRAISNYHATSSQWRGPDPTKQVISLNDDESIDITSNVKITINAPAVEVNCQTADVNASTGVNVSTPITAISGNCTIGGTLEVTGIVTNLATVITTGITTTGGLAVVGGAASNMGSGDVTSTGTVTVNGIDVETHTHPYSWTDGAGADDTDPPT